MSGILQEQGSWDPRFSLTSPSALPQELPASVLLTLEGLPLLTLGSCGMWGDTAGLGLKLLVFFAGGEGQRTSVFPAADCGEESGEKPSDLVKSVPGEWEDLGACPLLVPPPIGRAGPLDSLASASLASQKQLLPSYEDSVVPGPKHAGGQLFLCPLTSRVKVKPLNLRVWETFSSVSCWEGGR